MTETPNRYPLAWPTGRARRKPAERRRGEFSMTVGTSTKRVSLEVACDRLEEQINRLGGVYAILSSNVELRMDGRPRADRAPPSDPAVCVYFQLKAEPYAMACDTYTEVAQNIAALAAHIEATRRIERYGVASAAETLRAFSALPPPTGDGIIPMPAPKPDRPWWETFGVIRDSCDAKTVSVLYRSKAKGVDGPALLELNLARDAALDEIKAMTP